MKFVTGLLLFAAGGLSLSSVALNNSCKITSALEDSFLSFVLPDNCTTQADVADKTSKNDTYTGEVEAQLATANHRLAIQTSRADSLAREDGLKARQLQIVSGQLEDVYTDLMEASDLFERNEAKGPTSIDTYTGAKLDSMNIAARELNNQAGRLDVIIGNINDN